MLSRRNFLILSASAVALGGLGYARWPRLDAYSEEVVRQRETLANAPELTEFVRYACLAANGHNTQPWMFRVDSNRIDILPDLTRATDVVDPDHHHIFVSLGCAAENLALTAAAHGRPADIEIMPAAETKIHVALARGATQSSQLYDAIPFRQSTRSVYDGQTVPSNDMRALEVAARQDGVEVLFFTEEHQREAILDFVVAGNSTQMQDPAFVAELRDWLRFSPSEALVNGDGLFTACSGLPVLPKPLGSFMFDRFFTEEAENDKYRDQIRSSAGIAVFVGDHADPEHWIRVGRSFERFALQATARGIRTAHVNQPIEVEDIRAGFANWLGQSDARPDLVIRFGYAPALPMSIRRPVEDVMVAEA